MENRYIMIGQMIQIGITDFGDASVRNELRNLIKTGKVGGVILFEKNLQKGTLFLYQLLK